jgi:hypothetical protein
VSAEQSQKQFFPRISTEAGRQREWRDEHPENDPNPIVFNCEIPANLTSERKKQSRKQSSPSDSIEARTVNDLMG